MKSFLRKSVLCLSYLLGGLALVMLGLERGAIVLFIIAPFYFAAALIMPLVDIEIKLRGKGKKNEKN